MAANAQVLTFLAELKTYTDKMATAQEEEAATLAEIAADIDRLLASQSDAGLDPDVAAELQAHTDKIKAAAEAASARAQTLTDIAAKSDEPLPPLT